jgi:DNA-binding CsgD family transcriptional regulator/tetratricopeptide (TPR) repeat protein
VTFQERLHKPGDRRTSRHPGGPSRSVLSCTDVNLLERAGQVEAVVDRFHQLDHRGHLVLISGEAGAGKSALVQELLDHHLGAAQVIVGRCDDLFAPRPLGPLADIARGRPGPLADALAAGDQASVFDAFLAELASPPHPLVVVLEDLQWADEATLDLLRFVARRLDSLPCLILATHREDLAPEHALRRAFGSLVGPLVTRLHLAPLSVDAVRALVGDRHIDPVSLHASTGGNPFFLVETLDAAPGTLPASVRDVILTRTVPLSGAARDALDAAAVLGRQVGADLIQVVGDCDSAAVDECLQAGLLVDDGGHQAFRHDLSRHAIEESMTPLRRRQLHARALAALGDDGDVVQRAHHAIGAGDHDAIVDLAWRAADQCVALGAWRQAAILYGQALEHTGDLPDADRRRLLEARATTCLRVELVDEAVAAGEEAHALIAATNDDGALAEWECWMSLAYRAVGRMPEAREAADHAVERLEPLGESPALASALANVAGHNLVSGRFEECIASGRRAFEMAERFGLEQTAISALDSYGTALSCATTDVDGAVAALREALDRAKRAALPDEVARASSNLTFILTRLCQPALALPVIEDGIAAAEEHELRYRLNCMRPSRAEVLMLLGDWAEATTELGAVLRDPFASDLNRCGVLQLLGRIRARRGDPGAVDAIEEALSRALGFEEPQLIVAARIARSEAAWLAGDLPRAVAEVEASIPMVHFLDPGQLRELAVCATHAGVDWAPPDLADEATRLIVSGDHRTLARFWEEHGYPYDAADALADSDDVDDIRRAFEQLTFLGARPRAHQAARRLRELGARDVPRGPRASTLANAAGLTTRELEVAALLTDGLTNAEIAERLVVSQKTVDHHVSSVLTKLAVSSRREVAHAAAAVGLDLGDVVRTG